MIFLGFFWSKSDSLDCESIGFHLCLGKPGNEPIKFILFILITSFLLKLMILPRLISYLMPGATTLFYYVYYFIIYYVWFLLHPILVCQVNEIICCFYQTCSVLT